VHQLWVPEVGAVLQVVCCTLTGALGRHLEGEAGKFDVVFVDEAAQVSR
jgi:superfamily I DNA and/or RNA helicase